MTDGMNVAMIVGRAIETCYTRGLNLTPLRRRVLEVLAASSVPVSVTAIAEHLSAPSKHILPQGLYPTLDFLVEAGLVRHIGLRKAYLCREPDAVGGRALILVCIACESVVEIDAEPVLECIDRAASVRRFLSGGRAMEIEGRCSVCQKSHTE